MPRHSQGPPPPSVVDRARVVLWKKIERVARLVSGSGAVERERKMDRLFARTRGVEVDMLDDLRLHDLGLRSGLCCEIDLDDLAARRLRWGKCCERLPDPA